MAQVRIVSVPYQGGTRGDLGRHRRHGVAGVQSEALSYIRAGQLRPIGVTTASRSPFLKDTPAIAEQLPGYEVSAWYGLLGPAALPSEISARLAQAVMQILRSPEMQERLALVGGVAVGSEPAAFRRSWTPTSRSTTRPSRRWASTPTERGTACLRAGRAALRSNTACSSSTSSATMPARSWRRWTPRSAPRRKARMGPDAITGHGVAGQQRQADARLDRDQHVVQAAAGKRVVPAQPLALRRSNMASRYSPPGGNVTSGRGSGQARGASGFRTRPRVPGTRPGSRGRRRLP